MEIISQVVTKIKSLFDKPYRTRKDVEKVATELGVSISTVYRWISRYGKTGTLAWYHRNKGNRDPRLDPDVERLIREEIGHYPKKHSSIRQVYLAIKKRIDVINTHYLKDIKLNTPSYTTIRNRIRNRKLWL